MSLPRTLGKTKIQIGAPLPVSTFGTGKPSERVACGGIEFRMLKQSTEIVLPNFGATNEVPQSSE